MKLSIVTANFNYGAFLGDAVESVLSQNDEHVEHVVADGASTDQSHDVLARYPHLIVDCREDHGIYDGMNRGLSMATGDVIGLLNADDILAPGALDCVRRHFSRHPETDVMSGAFQYMCAIGTGPDAVVTDDFVPSHPPSYQGLLFGIPGINARFFRRDVLNKIGLFDLQFPLAADRIWLCHALQAGLVHTRETRPLYIYRQHDRSATLSKTDDTRVRLWSHHVDAARKLMGDAALPDDLRSALLQWHAVEGGKLIFSSRGRSMQSRFVEVWQADRLFALNFLKGSRAWRHFRTRHSDS